ncbi:MAG TPA: helix-turn-helix transcriptional regulator [Rhizomicrobium sp.]|nr:helix-turn-helix transcriptional regulator [Rhizomicrobium sp.]
MEVIVRARNAAGMTQRDLATALGKTPSFIAKIEQRERRMDVIELIAILRATGIKDADGLREVVASLPRRLEF